MAHLFSCNRVDSLNPVSNNENSLFHWQRPALQKPNIILILGDDVGYEIPTVNGGQSYATPNIDKMAQTGMRFTRCYASPLCSP
ncbi:MAG TPA: sulfatase-like hydrolase/transferase, partial [Panacibacter sp.]|nr:sulfatase-like hydrolase/transferase [Panacibacter sp.]